MTNQLRKLDDRLVWIWEEPDTFTQHITAEPQDLVTKCGIKYDSLPDEPLNPGEKPWYYDHDRRDVVACSDCRGWLDPEDQLVFSLKVWFSGAYDWLSQEDRVAFWKTGEQ